MSGGQTSRSELEEYTLNLEIAVENYKKKIIELTDVIIRLQGAIVAMDKLVGKESSFECL